MDAAGNDIVVIVSDAGRYAKADAKNPFPVEFVTLTGVKRAIATVLGRAGVTARISVLEMIWNEAAGVPALTIPLEKSISLKCTLVAVSKFAPLIVTVVPPTAGPLSGETDVTVGAKLNAPPSENEGITLEPAATLNEPDVPSANWKLTVQVKA